MDYVDNFIIYKLSNKLHGEMVLYKFHNGLYGGLHTFGLENGGTNIVC